MGQIELGILFPAFLAGMLVLATHVPLGQQVLTRGIVFIDLAIAQVAGLGVTAADAFGFEPQGWRVQAAAVCAALLGAFVLTWTEKKWPEVQEALIASSRDEEVLERASFLRSFPRSSALAACDSNVLNEVRYVLLVD